MNNITIIKPKIKRIELRLCGRIDYANITFKDGLNIIKGSCATGKTTVISAIIWALQRGEPVYECKTVEVEFFSNKIKHELIKRKEKTDLLKLPASERLYVECASLPLDGTEAVLLDDVMCRLDDKYRKKMLKFFGNSKSQIIMTDIDMVPSPPESNVIYTKDFRLRK